MAFVGNVQLVTGGAEKIPSILALLERDGIATKANPDIFAKSYSFFSIEDARSLRDRATRGAITGDRRVFIIVAPKLAWDAQNTLLKTLEEPAGDALFFFVVPSPETLLSTVRSRAQILDISGGAAAETTIDGKKFLSAAPAARLELLKPLLEKDADDRRDLGGIIMFLSSLERTLSTVKPLHTVAKGLDAVYRARKYISDNGALVKPLLEQVALLVPRV